MFLVKIKMPRIGATYVHRKRAESMLSKLDRCKFAFLSAPAGYGKTTAIIDYVNRSGKRCAWVSIDQDDNDPSRFWSCITASIAECVGLRKIEAIVNDAEHIASFVSIDLLIEAIETQSEAFILVLDDYHLITNADINKGIEHFIKLSPENVSFVFSSRIDPPKELAMLCVRGVGFNLERNDLMFSEENIKEYFSKNSIVVTDKENKAIYHYSEGWPAGIVAATMRIRERGNRKEYSKLPAQVDQNIAAYLESEVFDCWPEETKEFLIQTAFLDKLTGSLCDSVTGNNNSAILLRTLSKSNAFVISLDSNEEWYRYHHLFQDFLLERLKLRSNSDIKSFYVLAGEWYADKRVFEDAIKWFLEAKAYRSVVDHFYAYLEIQAVNPSKPISSDLLRSWHEMIPEEYYSDCVAMYTWYSWTALMNKEIDKARIWLDKAKQSYSRNMESLSLKQREQLEVAFLINALNIDIHEENLLKIYIDIEKIRKHSLSEPLQIGEINFFETRLLNTPLGFMGKLHNVDIYKVVMNDINKYMGDSAAIIIVILAEAFYEQNKLDKAMNLITSHITSIVSRCGTLVPAFILQAKIKMANGDRDSAFSIINDAKRLIGLDCDRLWHYHLDTFQAKLFVQAGEYEDAETSIESSDLNVYDTLSSTVESRFLVYARLLARSNRLDDALILLKRLERFARENNRLASLMEILCFSAVCYAKKTDYPNAMTTLNEAIERGSKEGYIRAFVDERETMSILVERYVSQNRNGGAGVHLTYARNLLKLINEQCGILNSLQQNNDVVKSRPGLLTKTELEITKQMMQQASNQQIADDLFLSINTIKKYNARIFDKLGVNNRFEAMQKAKQLGLSD